jgi:capsular exopolysaccharide synthesis family protein
MTHPPTATAPSLEPQQPPHGWATPIDEPGIDIKEIIGILKRRRWVIISCMLLVTTLATLIGLQQTPRYTATALLMIEPRESRIVDVEQVMQGLGTDTATVDTQIKVLKSRDLIERVMAQLKLFDDAEFNAALRQDDQELQLTYAGPWDRFLAWLPDEWLIASGLAEEPLPMQLLQDEGFVAQAAIDNFDSRLQVRQEGRSYVIAVNFTSVSPGKAARIANAAADLYVKDQLDAKLAATAKASGWLGDRLDALREDVRLAEEAVEAYRQQHDLIDALGVSMFEQELADLSREASHARAELAEKRTRLQQIRGMRSRGESLDSVAEVLNSMVIVNLRQQEAQLLRQESELRTYFGERHPRMQNLIAEKANLQEKIAVEVDRIIQNSENELQVLAGRVSSLEAEVDALSGRNEEERGLYVQLRELERQAQASRQLYEAFLQRFKETREQQDIIEADSRVISRAAAPDRPSTPGTTLFAAVGFTASVMLGGLLALLLERLDNGIRSGRQVEEFLGLHALGLVPRLDKLKRGMLPHHYLMAKPLSAYTESIRAIYTSLQLTDVDNPPKVVLVTSSLPQEGKSTLALSLATFAARSDQKVLLMDLDLRHPSVHRDLRARPEIGFVELMAGEKTLDEVIAHDVDTGIDYLPIKRQTANPTDLLSSRKMQQLLKDLRHRYNYVVIDSAPLLGVTDSKLVARLADKILFVTQWEKTAADTARNGLANLREVGASIGGSVLTQVDVKKHAYYGYGDVGQYYGKYQKYYVN